MCNLVAQSSRDAEGAIPARGRKGTDRRETELWELIYFKIYKSQIPVIEQALETAALMLGSDKSRGYCLEMICADFLAGANLNDGDSDVLLRALSRSFHFLPANQQQAFLQTIGEQIQ